MILLCLPSHTTYWLQPLDSVFFQPFKIFHRQECGAFQERFPSRKINRLQFGQLVKARQRSATLNNAKNAFSATGIYPYNLNTTTDEVFLMDHLYHLLQIKTDDVLVIQYK